MNKEAETNTTETLDTAVVEAGTPFTFYPENYTGATGIRQVIVKISLPSLLQWLLLQWNGISTRTSINQRAISQSYNKP
jgi:hypothetical protein